MEFVEIRRGGGLQPPQFLPNRAKSGNFWFTVRPKNVARVTRRRVKTVRLCPLEWNFYILGYFDNFGEKISNLNPFSCNALHLFVFLCVTPSDFTCQGEVQFATQWVTYRGYNNFIDVQLFYN